MATGALLNARLGAFLNEARRRSEDGIADEGEERLMFSGFTWDGYQALDKALGDNRPGPRLYFLDGEIEIMSTSEHHEELKKWLATLLEQYFLWKGVKAYPRGQATMTVLNEAGAEPDESWTFGERKLYPDLLIEIALTSGGLPKLEIYRRFRVPEVWIWRKGVLEVWEFVAESGRYEGPRSGSVLFPDLPMKELARCAVIADWTEAVAQFRTVMREEKDEVESGKLELGSLRGEDAPRDREWYEQCLRGIARSLESRIRYGFAWVHKPVLDDGGCRVFGSMAEYREWCDCELPRYLGYKVIGKNAGKQIHS